MKSHRLRVGMVVLAVAAAAVLGGCSRLAPWSDTISVSDPVNNRFHFKVPSSWLVSDEHGFVSLYAADKLPAEGQQAKALSVLVFSSLEPSTAPTADVLGYLVDARAISRDWQAVKKSPVKKASVGKREAIYQDVSAREPDGTTFDSRFYFVRTAGGETFIAAIAPTGRKIDSFDDQLRNLTEQWYWHNAATTAGSETSDTPGRP